MSDKKKFRKLIIYRMLSFASFIVFSSYILSVFSNNIDGIKYILALLCMIGLYMNGHADGYYKALIKDKKDGELK